jgi:hydrogenase nickel incorporation protein HypB
MCTTCGCGTSKISAGEIKIEGDDDTHHHPIHSHHQPDHLKLDFTTEPMHSHAPETGQTRRIEIEQAILAGNDRYALANRRFFTEQGIFALNLVSSPGAGKTTLLTATIGALQSRINIAVIEGDQQTSRDAERIRATGVSTVQINTGKGCHLDAHMVGHAMEKLAMPDNTVLFIENVGNLVCPAAFDLGEAHKVVVLSVTEGDDKPIKYPDMFHAADVMVLNKVDLLPYVDFDVEQCIHYARRINPDVQVIQLSATKGDGMDKWLDWVQTGCQTMIEG